MPFYTFTTTDRNVKQKTFEVHLTFTEYDTIMKLGIGPTHPETGKPCNKWKRAVENVNVNFAQPQDSSRWDNMDYRGAHLYYKATEHRRKAEALSHVGATPYLENEGIDLGQKDMEQYEGKFATPGED